MSCPTRLCCTASRCSTARSWWRYRAVLLVLVHLSLLLTSSAVDAAAAADAARSKALKQPKEVLTHVTFASCNRQHDDQSYWMHTIAPAVMKERGGTAAHTDLLLWLGNAVYADVGETGVAMRNARTPAGIEEEYKALTENPYYRQFVEEVVEAGGGRVVGIWDDRDLGLRFADANYTQAEAVRRLYLTQLWKGYPLSVKDNAGEGVHGALYSFTTVPAPANSPLATHFVNSVCTLTLDVRTQRSAQANLVHVLLRGTTEDGLRIYGTRGKQMDRQIEELRAEHAKVMEADLLGTAQWAWVERVISTYLAADTPSPGDAAGRAHCAVTLIASPWQILLNDNKPFEGWDLYPASRSKLLLLLKRYEVARLIFLSGHAETGEMGVVRRATKEDVTVEGPTASLFNSFPMAPLTKAAARLLPPLPSYLVELTTGGLTHTVQEAPFAGRLASWFTTPKTPEDKPENGFVKRYVFLTRTTAAQRNFGTLQLVGDAAAAPGKSSDTAKYDVLHHTRVILTLHGVQDGALLITFDKSLDNLPSYAVEPLLDEFDEEAEAATKALDLHDVAHLPVFNTFNLPGEIPWLKRRLAERQCAEVPCANGQHYMLLKVVGTLTLAFVMVLLVIVAAYYYQQRNPEIFEPETPTKLKQD
ncbi:hypothetical protein ABB37_00955 [Leptomonas pyrrhocoris]|uniref:Uncharacterized protein n=1 Tax=Leptomonas pyrrhocoris TaxID=157538 RepID=A0A0N0E0W6_LEPPY|nr:hypothetical protein ABB37_00955 [Leptomonas pyrrhocoris]KPA86922.1 hypothetical protein ABB37_00955 [Leptomonas pyrrhocoris]|eukprot:XP_015665361.1 hypothetical protein ABB37_00955 [Leptomonas pyrrhocoris]